jgi:hypothetical protein
MEPKVNEEPKDGETIEDLFQEIQRKDLDQVVGGGGPNPLQNPDGVGSGGTGGTTPFP